MSNALTLDQQQRLSHLLTSFNKDEAIWAIKYLLKKFYSPAATQEGVKDDTVRKAKVKSRGHDLSDEEVELKLANFPDLADIPDVDIKAFLRSQSGKGLTSMQHWL